MKKTIVMFLFVMFVITLSGCGNNKQTLYVLNWGEYMDDTLIEKFEDEFNVNVQYDTVDSNEAMEIRLKSKTTPYDIAIPSDYMIDKLRQQDLLNEIDTTKLDALNDVSFLEDVENLTKDKAFHDYFVPYFWGTIGIMYNTDTVNVEDLTGFDVLFDPNTTYKIGMYDSSRDAVAAALLALDKDVNTSDEADLTAAENLMKAANIYLYGTDDLKEKVQKENIDMALVYSGDYFDLLYQAEEEEATVNFEYFVPDKTNVWVDGMVIPTTSQQTDLAYDFINFFLEEENAVQNADWVGYAPVTEEAYNMLISDEYGYDYDNYYPYPEDSERVIYEFVSSDRFQRLDDILKAAKGE